MGVTSTSIQLIERALKIVTVKNVMELGAQNLYDKAYPLPLPYASELYLGKGIEYSCIDLNGENGAMKMDLEKKYLPDKQFDLVTDFGTGEHVRNAYNVMKIIHDLAKPGGILIRQNPKTGNWNEHGFWYITQEFYRQLARAQGYQIIELGEDAAMGNTTDGWNVYCICKKVNGNPFITKKLFKTIPVCSS